MLLESYKKCFSNKIKGKNYKNGLREGIAKTYYENAKLGDKVIIEGDITSGNCYLVFE